MSDFCRVVRKRDCWYHFLPRGFDENNCVSDSVNMYKKW